ncbi:hypothetical protein [Cohnella rhizosphaerae]|uniref:Alginate lyase domain-containing protein n=1 Tax=Cohnella rhizosphaerae TaxID=1457232 RepID=A0A9X4QXI1_9BACL|nr:hypothetical protein [Cohnella rhizosphaerae]MDG0813522.1 hypothetical protein [Cohnella rhizosphaerae]
MLENQADARSGHGSGHRFRERTRLFTTKVVEAAGEWYDREGTWTADTTPPHTRERYWLAGALYAAGEAEWANAIAGKGETESYGDIRFNIFNTNIAASLLIAHRDKMSAVVRDELASLVRDGFSFKPGNRQPDFQFHGYNDNMPAKATAGLILGGQLLGNREAVDYGIWNLRQFRAMLVRSGINSEFNSPTYTGLTIRAMGEIAEHAEDEEARALALGIERRLWIDLAARFHPEMGVLAGPYSRAYTVDNAAHASCISGLLWFCLGDRVHPSPMLLFDKPDDLVLHHMGDVPFNVAQFCWFAGGEYHIPDTALRLFEAKPYPFRAVASCELGAGEGTDFLARSSRIETALFPDYALGTSSAPFGSMEQNNSYFVTYKRKEIVDAYRDIGTIFTKLVVNDEVPGTIVRAKDGDREYANAGGSRYCPLLRQYVYDSVRVYGARAHASASLVRRDRGPQAAVGDQRADRPVRARRGRRRADRRRRAAAGVVRRSGAWAVDRMPYRQAALRLPADGLHPGPAAGGDPSGIERKVSIYPHSFI